MNKISIYLKDLGLSDIESKIYLNILKNGPSTILEISKRTALNRITTHVNCDNLAKKGLISTLKKGGRRFLIPESPDKLRSIIEAEEMEISRKKATLTETISLLKNEALHIGAKTYFDVRTYEGRDAISMLYDEILKSKEIRAYVNPEKIYDLFPENFNKFKLAALEGRIEIWDINESNELARQSKEATETDKYHIKLLPEGVNIGSMDYLIHDNKITIIEGDQTPVAVVISSPSLYLNSKAIFDVMWKLI